jgi:hypothetical protein
MNKPKTITKIVFGTLTLVYIAVSSLHGHADHEIDTTTSHSIKR